jgi:hypothetical protein
MATKSKYVTDDDIRKFRDHIKELEDLRAEVVLATKSNIDVGYTPEDIDKQIADIKLIIKNYSQTGS